MNNKPLSKEEAEARKQAESKTAFLAAVILGGLIFAMIAGMLAFDIYGERVTGSGHVPTEAADR